jgi:hypothetical protein
MPFMASTLGGRLGSGLRVAGFFAWAGFLAETLDFFALAVFLQLVFWLSAF